MLINKNMLDLILRIETELKQLRNPALQNNEIDKNELAASLKALTETIDTNSEFLNSHELSNLIGSIFSRSWESD